MIKFFPRVAQDHAAIGVSLTWGLTHILSLDEARDISRRLAVAVEDAERIEQALHPAPERHGACRA
jgi:hypothetical protein